MSWSEFCERFFKHVPILDFDMVPILAARDGNFYSPGGGDACRVDTSEAVAIKYWKDKGYRYVILREKEGGGSGETL